MNKIFKNILFFAIICCISYISISVYKDDKALIFDNFRKHKTQLLQKVQIAQNNSNPNEIHVSDISDNLYTKDKIKKSENEYLIANSNKEETTYKLNLENNEYSTKYEKLFLDVLERVKAGYIEKIEEKKLIENALNGMLSSLDPHSDYMTAEDFKEMQVQTKGEFGGLGIEITIENSFVKVISPIEGTPAFKAGIKSGDYITHINDETVMGLSLMEAVKLMRGKPNTKIKITIIREGEKKPLDFKLKRGVIKIRAVRSAIEGNIGYIKLNSFTEQTYNGMIKEFNKVENAIGKENLVGLVLDLRSNPGGLLDQAIMIADTFLNKDKTILTVKGRGGEELNVYKDKRDEDLIPNIPMVVLINEGSASASEIVAGALQDNGRAIIMGKKSFGKGSVQSVIPVEMGGAIRMTIARYYTPSGRSIQAEGVEPDIIVEPARIEMIESGSRISSEESLKGHLKKEQSENGRRKDQLKTYNQALYDKDYQLARAIDLLLGISFYQKTNK